MAKGSVQKDDLDLGGKYSLSQENVLNKAGQRVNTSTTLLDCFPSEIFCSMAIENSWQVKLLLKPIDITAKTSFPSRRQFTASLCPGFSLKLNVRTERRLVKRLLNMKVK